MRIRSPLTLASCALIVSLALVGCSSPLDQLQEGLDDLTEQLGDVGPPEDDNSTNDPVDEEIVEEAAMPSGFPSDLPLPDGTLTDGMRSDSNFFLAYTGSTAASLDAMVQWFTSNGWELLSDVELPPTQAWEYGSPETNDYGNLRSVAVSFNSETTEVFYSLTVRND